MTSPTFGAGSAGDRVVVRTGVIGRVVTPLVALVAAVHTPHHEQHHQRADHDQTEQRECLHRHTQPQRPDHDDGKGNRVQAEVPVFMAGYPFRIRSVSAAAPAPSPVWFKVTKHGSPTPRRRRPRSDVTTGLHLRRALPILRAWLPPATPRCGRSPARTSWIRCRPRATRSTAEQGLNSIFRTRG